MDSPFVTVFMPVYNCEQYIKESLESIINQTYENIEILLVNDGSTDHSVDIINNYQDPRIRLLHNSQNMGIPYTRNVGLREAKGKYLVVMDSDDVAAPNRVETQVKFLESHPEIDAIGSNYIRWNGSSKRKIEASFTSPEALAIMLLFFDPISNPSSAIRLETLKKHQITYHEDFFVAQDYELWSQLSKVGKLCIIPEFLLYYRTGHENITKKSNRERLKKRKTLISRIRGDLLSYYGIVLNEEELHVYNEFFIHSYGGELEDKALLLQAIRKIQQWNKDENQVLNQELFRQILDSCILTGISNHDIPLSDKQELYRKLVSKQRVKDRFYIVIKHFYYRLRK